MSRTNSHTSYFGRYAPPEPIDMVHWTEFELKCQELGLDTFEKQFESLQLRIWVQCNKGKYYVPEGLLKAWNFTVYIDVD